MNIVYKRWTYISFLEARETEEISWLVSWTTRVNLLFLWILRQEMPISWNLELTVWLQMIKPCAHSMPGENNCISLIYKSTSALLCRWLVSHIIINKILLKITVILYWNTFIDIIDHSFHVLLSQQITHLSHVVFLFIFNIYALIL